MPVPSSKAPFTSSFLWTYGDPESTEHEGVNASQVNIHSTGQKLQRITLSLSIF